MSLAFQHQVSTGEESGANGYDAEELNDRTRQCLQIHHPDRPLVVVPSSRAKAPPLERFHGEPCHEFMRALVAEVVDVEVNHIAIETIAQVVQGEVDDASNQRILPELEETADQYAGNDQANQAEKRQEWATGQVT